MSTYLVTGGAGFIGSQLAVALINAGHQVTIIDNLSTGDRKNIPVKAEFILGDCADSETIKRLGGEKFSAILHIAGQSSGEISFEDPARDLKSNTLSTLLLLDYARNTGCDRFIYASTMSVYGSADGKECFSENDPTDPLSFYAVGKLASEQYLKIYGKQYGIKTTALRFFNVYGPGQNLNNLKQGMISIYLRQFIDGQFDCVTVKGSLDRYRDFIHIEDLVKIILRLMNDKRTYGEILNVGTGVKTRVKEIVSSLANLLNSNKPVLIQKGTPGDQFGICADLKKLRSLYPDLTMMNLLDGLREWVQKLELS